MASSSFTPFFPPMRNPGNPALWGLFVFLMISCLLAALQGCKEKTIKITYDDSTRPAAAAATLSAGARVSRPAGAPLSTPRPSPRVSSIPSSVAATPAGASAFDPQPRATKAEGAGPGAARACAPAENASEPRAAAGQDPFTVFIDFSGGDFFPRVKVELRTPEGALVAEDFCSEDGRGIARKLDCVKRGGYYRFRVYSLETVQAPYFDKILHVTEKTFPRFFLGSVRFRIPGPMKKANAGRFQLVLRKSLDNSLVYKGDALKVEAYSVYGDSYQDVVVLEPGKYCFDVIDLEWKDPVTSKKKPISKVAAGTNEFTISREFPQAEIDLRSILSDRPAK